jgi:hypothetical protein
MAGLGIFAAVVARSEYLVGTLHRSRFGVNGAFVEVLSYYFDIPG